jgi:hypothetical protein
LLQAPASQHQLTLAKCAPGDSSQGDAQLGRVGHAAAAAVPASGSSQVGSQLLKEALQGCYNLVLLDEGSRPGQHL